jgi:hypothetical protein
MFHKLVLRLLTADNEILGWVEHEAVARGDGCLRATAPVIIIADAPGAPAHLSVHWCELNVETRYPTPDAIVKARDVCPIFAPGDAIVKLDAPPVGLPAVSTKGHVSLGIPVGAIGASGHAGS